MSDLIDREAFIEHERKLYCENCGRRRGMRNGKLGGFVYEIGYAPYRACSIDDKTKTANVRAFEGGKDEAKASHT